ncbi:hypothetical protein DBA26_11335 [Brucella canis]|uniref:Uncharacterized protein n=1 Tax=Brucella suis TaxID=29461 RepID=A0AAI8H748_BRUSS|nr:hypothetical protein CRN66_12745 [Brucella canis]ATQ52867.1 hypothetical protein CS875_09815 [Brucella suis]KDV05789.1 hypothetical protein BF16_13990 [Brucella suis 1330]AVO72540.1 hypothetical protein C6Y57_12085 [Brucella canis]PXG13190.1 hypothetical protein DMP29_04450 [Brucella suis]
MHNGHATSNLGTGEWISETAPKGQGAFLRKRDIERPSRANKCELKRSGEAADARSWRQDDRSAL